jgi:hypothetical protein
MRHIAAAIAVIAAGSLGCAAPETCTHLGQPVTFAAAKPLTLRVDAGSVWASASSVSYVSRVWTLPASGPVDGLSVRALPACEGYLVSFRQGGVAWYGELDASRSPRGPLHVTAEPGAVPGRVVAAR